MANSSYSNYADNIEKLFKSVQLEHELRIAWICSQHICIDCIYFQAVFAGFDIQVMQYPIHGIQYSRQKANIAIAHACKVR